jgi:hypothetical protein
MVYITLKISLEKVKLHTNSRKYQNFQCILAYRGCLGREGGGEKAQSSPPYLSTTLLLRENEPKV